MASSTGMGTEPVFLHLETPVCLSEDLGARWKPTPAPSSLPQTSLPCSDEATE